MTGPDDVQALWTVDLLGGLRLSDGRRQLTRLPSRAITALLARLALAPERAHAREELIELLWPGVGLDVGRNRLRQALSTLKSILEPAGRVPPQPVLVADRISVRIAPAGLTCDAVRFERALRAGRDDDARQLYRGELLPGFYDDWIDEERIRLEALHDRLPLSEAVRASRPTAAPAPTVAGGARVVLPTYLTRVFGADEQTARLRALVLAQRLVTLIGPGGSGKTRLAIEAAHALRDDPSRPQRSSEPFEPFDLIAFVPLDACGTRAQALDAVTGALRIALESADPLLALTEALAGHRVLLVLDNFEQLVDAAASLVGSLLAVLPGLHVVTTSRHALGIDGEREFTVAALALPSADADPQTAAANPAVALFVERAQAVRADFHVSARNGAALIELVRALDGMPLAIELAASRVRSIAVDVMLTRLRGAGTPSLDLLSRSRSRGLLDARHASMQRVIAWSWQQLEAEQARLLGSLAVFAGGFTASAAAALVGDEPIDAPLLLDALVANSLVHAHSNAGADGELRFGLYQPIREYAASHQDEATAAHWRARLRVWALDWTRELPATPPLQAIRTEMPNLLAAMASAVAEGAPGDAIELLLALRAAFEHIELPAEGLLHAQEAVDQCRDPLLAARGHTALAPLLFGTGQAEAALQHAERGLACADLDAALRARALYELANARWRSRRRGDEVEPLLDEAERLAEPIGDLDLRASLRALRAFVTNAHRRDHVRGEALHAEALALWERSGNRLAVDTGRYNLAGCVAQYSHRFLQAIERLEPIIANARASADWRRLGQSLNVRGNAYCGLIDWRRAVIDYQECVRTAWQSMASFDLAYGLWNMTRALTHLRQPEAAIRLAAFAASYWRARFGELGKSDLRYIGKVRRLAGRQIDAARIEALWREGEGLSLAQAVAVTQGIRVSP